MDGLRNNLKIAFPKQATLTYIDTFLKYVREARSCQNKDVSLDLSNTMQVTSLAICFIAGLVDLLQAQKNEVSVLLPKNKKAARLIRDIISNPPDKIYAADSFCQVRKIMGNNQSIIKEILAVLAPNLKMMQIDFEWLLTILTELLTNVSDHSGEKSCYLCIGRWGRSQEFHVTFLDFGLGIPNKIRTRFSQYGEADDDLILKDLLEKGLTTRVYQEGGRGYQYIQEILRNNKGRLHVFSGRSKNYHRYDRGEFEHKKAQQYFYGTCVDFQFHLNKSEKQRALFETTEEYF